jgi:hypothetical protein
MKRPPTWAAFISSRLLVLAVKVPEGSYSFMWSAVSSCLIFLSSSSI